MAFVIFVHVKYVKTHPLINMERYIPNETPLSLMIMIIMLDRQHANADIHPKIAGLYS